MEKKSTHLLPISDVLKIDGLTDFLKLDEELEESQELEELDQKEEFSYVCQNAFCHAITSDFFHLYEITADHLIVICHQCYEEGYRFCLFTHDVLHLSDLDPVFDNMYAQNQYHQNQLDSSILKNVKCLADYFQMIGIENPNPNYYLINNQGTDLD